MRVCKHCGDDVPETSGGHQCYRCINGLRRYGLDKLQQEKLYRLQGGTCAFCFDPVVMHVGSGKSGCIDHDHRTGEVRGILCNECNITIGKIEKRWDLDEFLEKLNVYRRRGEVAA